MNEFTKLEAPFADIELLGCRDVFFGEKLILDFIEFERGDRAETNPPTNEPEYFLKPKRTWRMEFEQPFAVRLRNQSLESKQPLPTLPGRCCVSDETDWLSSLVLPRQTEAFAMLHYVFDLIDNCLEVIGSDDPVVEELSNETSDPS